MVHVREGLPGTDELTIRHAFRMPSGYEIGDSGQWSADVGRSVV